MTFSHDGLRDSLTHLAAPPYFYENLRRDLNTASRNRSQLSLIRFQITPRNLEDYDQSSRYEVAILSFAELLKSCIRAEDLCARLGRYEFTLILRAPLSVADSLSQRVISQWRNELLTCQTSSVAVKHGESSLEILNRLDNQELKGVTESS